MLRISAFAQRRRDHTGQKQAHSICSSTMKISIALLSLFCVATIADRGSWLCGVVEEAARMHSHKNVIAFSEGMLQPESERVSCKCILRRFTTSRERHFTDLKAPEAKRRSAFAGACQFKGISSIKEIEYEADGCKGEGQYYERQGESSSLTAAARMGKSLMDTFLLGGQLDGMRRDIAHLKGSAMSANSCHKFRLVEFDDGTFERFGDGGFDHWCFMGTQAFVV